MTEAGGGGNPPLSELIRNAEIGTDGARKPSFRDNSLRNAKICRRSKKEERKRIVCEYMGEQCTTRESRSYCKSNSNARETKITDENQKVKDFLDAKVISVDANEDTYEKLAKHETNLKKKILAFIEKPPKYAGNPKEVFSWCEKL